MMNNNPLKVEILSAGLFLKGVSFIFATEF